MGEGHQGGGHTSRRAIEGAAMKLAVSGALEGIAVRLDVAPHRVTTA
jgi:hypothetical protein